jgi:drug/metabolite transporter (DMT)-like permease
MAKKYPGLFLLLISVLCWGPAPVASKLALTEVPVWIFVFIGRIISLSIVLLFFARKKYLKIDKKDVPSLALAGLTGTVLNIGFFSHGIQLTGAMDAQAIFSSGPVITAILAVVFLKEKLKLAQIAGVLIGFLGAMAIAGRAFFETGSLDPTRLFGNGLIFAAALSWVAYILISKKLSRKYLPETILIYSFIAATITFAPFALVQFQNIGTSWISGVTEKGILGTLYISVVASFFAFFFYQRGLKNSSAFVAGLTLYLQPIITTFVAAIILGEKITLPFIIGAILIIIGSFIATQLRKA